ncbi:MAG: O-methyltransferase family 3 [Ferruginibacter sp.]|nr:O-methyltransferase family 3 [Ferruginibacter sp.]
MELVHHLAEQYAAAFTSPEDELIQAVAEHTQTHPHAHMLSGHVQGTFLTIISSLLQPRRILEIGTFTGYSALCLAKGLTSDGTLHTIELRAEDAATAGEYFNKSPEKEKIILHVGNAKDIIPSLMEIWDIVFIDADKPSYIDYYELILPTVKRNGLIIADNVLFHGQVLEENISRKNAVAIHAFNIHVKEDPRVEQSILTIRDGLMMIRKL